MDSLVAQSLFLFFVAAEAKPGPRLPVPRTATCSTASVPTASTGNPIAWPFAVVGLGGLVWWCVDYSRKRANKNVPPTQPLARSDDRSAPATGEAPCPRCGGSIRTGASFCKHCREFLS